MRGFTTVMMRLAVRIAAVLLLATAASSASTARTGPTTGNATPMATVSYPREPIPYVPVSILPIYAMSKSAPPRDFVSNVIKTAWPGSTPLALNPPHTFEAAFSRGRLVAYVDQSTGDAEIFSDLEHLPPASVKGTSAVQTALNYIKGNGLIPSDETTSTPNVTILDESRSSAGGRRSTKGADVLAFVSLQRHVSINSLGGFGSILSTLSLIDRSGFVHKLLGRSLPVFGTGSRALLAIDGNGNVQGFLRQWRTATRTNTPSGTISAETVHADIAAQLSSFEASSSSIKVDHWDIGYYEGQSYLQPVIFYLATIRHGASSGSSVDHFIGYVPIGSTLERIPSLVPSNIRMTASATPDAKSPIAPQDPTVSTYVIRKAESMWKDSAAAFWSGINTSSDPGQFSRIESLGAMPQYYLTDKNSHVDGANIVDTEGHGAWWRFSTFGSSGDIVDIKKIPGNGYGSGGQGSLAYWILHSCEVIPSQWDVQQDGGDGYGAFVPWIRVFGGLREVLGFRTQMFIDDDVMGGFGKDMGRGGIALSSWFNHVSAAPIYQYRTVCHSDRLHADLACGRASAMVVVGHDDDSMLVESAPLSNSKFDLVNFWMQDQ